MRGRTTIGTNQARRIALELGLRAAVLAVVVWGHPFSYDVHGYWRRMHTVSLHHLPYRDFLWEFPPLTIPAVLPARWLSQTAFTAMFVGIMVAAEYGTLLLLRHRFPERQSPITRYWHWVGLPLAAQAWFRLDFISVLLATVALLAILAGRSGALPMALGFLAKLWPAILAVVLVVQGRFRQAAVAVGAVAAALALWVAFSPSGFDAFLRYRHGSGVQIESLLGAPLFAAGAKLSSASDSYVVGAGSLGWVDPLLLAVFTLLVVVALVALRGRAVEPVSFAGALIVALMLLSRILSPQYLVWVLPFAALTWAAGDRRGAPLFAVAAWLTAFLNWEYDHFVSGEPVMQGLVIVRNLVLLASGIALLRRSVSG